LFERGFKKIYRIFLELLAERELRGLVGSNAARRFYLYYFEETVRKMCFCGSSKPSSKGRNAIEAYDKVDKDDKSTFRLNATKGMPTDRETIDKMTKNVPKHTIKLGSAKAETANLGTGDLGELVKRKIMKSEYEDLL
jgi:hypothetical protein